MYISYARNSEDEYFVLSTLRCVLENTFGYSVCIFDRDSLPGGSKECTHCCTLLHTATHYCAHARTLANTRECNNAAITL